MYSVTQIFRKEELKKSRKWGEERERLKKEESNRGKECGKETEEGRKRGRKLVGY